MHYAAAASINIWSQMLWLCLIGVTCFLRVSVRCRVGRFPRIDLRRADGDLLKKLVVLQHALKQKNVFRLTAGFKCSEVLQTTRCCRWNQVRLITGTSTLLCGQRRRKVASHRQVVDSLRERSNLPDGALRVLHLPTVTSRASDNRTHFTCTDVTVHHIQTCSRRSR